MASELKHEDKFTWPLIPRNHHRRFYLNMAIILSSFIPLVMLVSDFPEPPRVSSFQIIGLLISAQILTVIMMFFINRCNKYAITTEGIYKSNWPKTRSANEDTFFPWDKIKFVEVRKTAFCWFAWDWTAVVRIRAGMMKIGLNDERLQEFLGAIQQCAPESIWRKTQESYNKNK